MNEAAAAPQPRANEALPRLAALRMYVRDLATSRAFWAEHFNLSPDESGDYTIDGVRWRLHGGAQPCGTRGPHFALPAFRIADFGRARGYLQARGIPIVFEEMLPGANLLIFLDPDATPVQLTEDTDPRQWDVAQRRELRTRRRQDVASDASLQLLGLHELTLYTHDVSASGRFYRDVLGLPAGLSLFAHIHLVAENVPVVLRSTHWRCRAPQQPHAFEPLFTVADLEVLASRLRQAGYEPTLASPQRLVVTDPTGLRLHIASAA